jgi:hypothetical protein
VSISTTFYDQIFWYESVFVAFLNLEFGFVIFCKKNIIEKAVHKMFLKLTEGVSRQLCSES